MENKITETVKKKAQFMLKDYEKQWNAMDVIPDTVLELESSNKFLSCVYSVRIHVSMMDSGWTDTFDGKYSFIGIVQAQGVLFKKVKGCDVCIDAINKRKGLSEKIYNISRKVDIESIKVNFNKEVQLLQIIIKPYAGAYVWIKFPPLQRKVSLSHEELHALHELTQLLKTNLKR